MPSRKVSRSRKHSRHSSKRSRAAKLRSRKSQRGGGNYEFSDDGHTWYPATDYQIEALKAAAGQDLDSYEYNKNGIVFTLRKLRGESDGTKIIYKMTRENGSIAYLRFIMYQNSLKKAFANRLTGGVG